jgi:glucosamine--fructose-6-phosphate aminotransferase (isomerizing)
MAGMFGILGKGHVAPEILAALRRLEYRGYDSAGIAAVGGDGKLHRQRVVGKLDQLSEMLVEKPLRGRVGIGHTRWATHGSRTIANSHPLIVGSVAAVQNGIVENYRDLKSSLDDGGYFCESETDAEVIPLLIQRYLDAGYEKIDAAQEVFRVIEGAFAFLLLFEGEEDLLIGARNGSPLAIGLADGCMMASSDSIAVAPLTGNIAYLEDGDLVLMGRNSFDIFDKKGDAVEREFRKIQSVAADEGSYGRFGSFDSATTESQGHFSVELVRDAANRNSAAVYLSLLALEEQVGAFIERVRGSNSLIREQKDEYLSFLVQLQMNIAKISAALPSANENASVPSLTLATCFRGFHRGHSARGARGRGCPLPIWSR